MVMTNSPRAQRLGLRDEAAVTEVLSEAFYDYPVMRYVLKDAGERHAEQLREWVGYLTTSRLQRACIVLGVEEGGRLVAASNINPPEQSEVSEALKARHRRMVETIGEPAIARIERFAEACRPFEIDEPHHYVGMLGVLPSHQGRGLGRLLLDEVQRLSREHEASTGVLLTTEDPGNVRLYEHLGFTVLGEGRAEELVTWTLFRAD